jgi:hypothetical protein
MSDWQYDATSGRIVPIREAGLHAEREPLPPNPAVLATVRALRGRIECLEQECDALTRRAEQAEQRVRELEAYPRRLLRERMEALSEAWWCAGWMGGWEYMLWACVVGDAPGSGMGALTEAERADLRQLAEDAGGWWVWDETLPDDVLMALSFVPLAAWQEQYAAQRPRYAFSDQSQQEEGEA